MTDLAALRERVRTATGPDHELTLAVAVACGAQVCPRNHRFIRWPGEDATYWQPPPYTASIDAAVALVERVLPNKEYRLDSGHKHRPHARIYLEKRLSVARHSATLPLAILAALLAALDARDDA